MKCLRRTFIAAAAAIGLSAVPAKAFECSGVKLPSNVVICSDPELIGLADERQQVFNETRWGADGTNLLDPQQDKELWENQRSWVRSYATACGVPPDGPTPRLPVAPGILRCFKEAAEARIAFLRHYRANTSRPSSATPIGTIKIGPGFDCAAASHDTLAAMVCADPDLARTDLRFNQAFWALLQQLDETHRRQFKQEDVEFLERVHAQCGVPHSGGLTPEVLSARPCVKQAYEAERSLWISRLSGAAYEEATRPIEEHILLERRLRELALLTSPPIPEGVYGPTTRRAISDWQRSTGMPATGLLGNSDALALQSARQTASTDNRAPEVSRTNADDSAVAAETVQLEAEHGVFMVPVRINDAITIPFVLDSGAGDLSVPEDVFKTLLRTRTVTESDLLSPGTYINADGSERSKQRFILHEVRVGDHLIRDIEASVAPDKADPLLGQSFLGKLPGWAIDNTKHTLLIGVSREGVRPQLPLAPTRPATKTSAKSVLADDLRNAQNSIGSLLQKNGGGLAANQKGCPSIDISDRANDGWEYVEKTQSVAINETSTAILIDSEMCNGGNGYGQYLVITESGSARVITNAEIADMSFLGSISRVEENSVILTGHRWGPNDPHCCPSREATLEYDIRTGQHKFTLGKRLQ
jgi:uncharacterized protein/predicted aspartyl protease